MDGYVHYISINTDGDIIGPTLKKSDINISGTNDFILMI